MDEMDEMDDEGGELKRNYGLNAVRVSRTSSQGLSAVKFTRTRLRGSNNISK